MVEVPKVDAQIGYNHKREMDIAKELISTAPIFCKADYVKFHTCNNREMLSGAMYNAPHPNPGNSHGAAYEPDGMCRQVQNVARALKPEEAELLPVEVRSRRNLKWEPVAPGTMLA